MSISTTEMLCPKNQGKDYFGEFLKPTRRVEAPLLSYDSDVAVTPISSICSYRIDLATMLQNRTTIATISYTSATQQNNTGARYYSHYGVAWKNLYTNMVTQRSSPISSILGRKCSKCSRLRIIRLNPSIIFKQGLRFDIYNPQAKSTNVLTSLPSTIKLPKNNERTI